jgi:hypothetical protein
VIMILQSNHALRSTPVSGVGSRHGSRPPVRCGWAWVVRSQKSTLRFRPR